MKSASLKTLFLAIAWLFITEGAYTQLKLSPLFTNNMVLQRNSNAPIWGRATAGVTVTVTASWNNRAYTTKSDSDGKWKLSVETPDAGGPYAINIASGNEITLENVMIGEVWICSGQSNMEMPLAGWGKILNYESEIANANYPDIRLLQVKKATSNRPLDSFEADATGWQECSPATIPEFSATAYFFGRELQNNLNIPIGLIHTSWGGTPAESWVSSETLSNMHEFTDRIEEFQQLPDDEEAEKKLIQQKVEAWNKHVATLDFGIENGVAAAAHPSFDTTGWEAASVPGVWESNGHPGFDGFAWYRKNIEIPKSWTGKDLILSLGTIDDNDVTYFNGTEIGRTTGFNVERRYIIPKTLVQGGESVITVRVTDTGGDGGFYGDSQSLFIHPQDNGSSKTGLSGAWKFKKSVDLNEVGPFPQLQSGNPHNPTSLYNAMIAPLIPYAMRGAIWYQGESNADRAYQYRTLFPLMIQDWRHQWENKFPFYFVQLANFMQQKAEPAESAWAELREAQLQTLHLNKTGMAVIIDAGEADDIHPKNKQDVGKRLAFLAAKNTYGIDMVDSGPIYKSYRIEGQEIRISFYENPSNLVAAGGRLAGFSIAGPDRKFYWADAVIDGNEVVVSSRDVKFPVAVRYAWADNPTCSLYNEAGLPASPFRTDDWVGITTN